MRWWGDAEHAQFGDQGAKQTRPEGRMGLGRDPGAGCGGRLRRTPTMVAQSYWIYAPGPGRSGSPAGEGGIR